MLIHNDSMHKKRIKLMLILMSSLLTFDIICSRKYQKNGTVKARLNLGVSTSRNSTQASAVLWIFF